MVTKEILEKFKRLYQEKYNIILSDEEVMEMATSFLNLMKVLIYPKPKLTSNQIVPEQERQNEINRL